MYDTPPIGQKKIRIEEDYCEIDVSCPFVLIFIDLKNVSNKREHNEEISPFRGILHFEKKKWYFPNLKIQIFKINYKIKINNSISHSASDNIANNSSNWAATTRFFNLFTKSRIYDEGVETASRPTSGDNSSVIFFLLFFPLPSSLSSPTPLQSTPWKRRRVTHGNSFIRIFTNENSRHLRAYEWAPRCSERLVKPHRRRRKENEGKNVRWGDTGDQPLRGERERRKKKNTTLSSGYERLSKTLCVSFSRNRALETE